MLRLPTANNGARLLRHPELLLLSSAEAPLRPRRNRAACRATEAPAIGPGDAIQPRERGRAARRPDNTAAARAANEQGLLFGRSAEVEPFYVKGQPGGVRLAQRVPYGRWKLTHILMDSLGWTRRTLMVAAGSLFKPSFRDTHNTLKYAERAMQIQLQAKKSNLNLNVHMSMYNGLISDINQKSDGLQGTFDACYGEKPILQAKRVELEANVQKQSLQASAARCNAWIRFRDTGGAVGVRSQVLVSTLRRFLNLSLVLAHTTARPSIKMGWKNETIASSALVSSLRIFVVTEVDICSSRRDVRRVQGQLQKRLNSSGANSTSVSAAPPMSQNAPTPVSNRPETATKTGRLK